MLFSRLLLLGLATYASARHGGRDTGRGGDGDEGGEGGGSSSASTPSSTASASSPSSSSLATNGSTSGLTGDSVCESLMCISAVVNGSTVQYTLQSTGSSSLGWMAIGFGSQMANTPMVIMWSNTGGSITLSQRQASGEVMPTVVASPPRVATASSSLSTTSGSQPQFVFTIPANSDTKQNLIWAFGTQNPGSSADDATLLQHLSSGTLTLDLAKTISSSNGTPTSSSGSGGSSGSGSSGSSGSVSIPFLSYQKLIIAHAVFMGIAFMVILPAGALFARYLRTFTHSWFKGHWIIQLGVAGPMILTGLILGILSVHSAGAPHLDDMHKRFGIVVFVLYIVQCSLGGFIHYVKPQSLSWKGRRPPQNYVHALLGLAVIGMAINQVYTGYKKEWEQTTGREDPPNGVNVAWIVLTVVFPVAYFAGLFLLPRQFRQEQEARMTHRSTRPPSVAGSDRDDVSLHRMRQGNMTEARF